MPGLIPHVPLFPLAQMNTSIGGGAASAPAAAPGAAPAAPAVTATGGTAETASPAATGAATSTATGTAPATGPADAPKGNPWAPFVLILVMFGLLYFVMFRGQRKDEKKRKQMIEEVKKGDQVMTIGGMLARVVSIDGDEVVLKIDESANVKATYRKSAIQEVLDRDEKK